MKQFVQAIFCPPNDKLEDLNLPSRLTDETFSMLKEMKINRLFGWGWDSRPKTIVKTLELCEKYDIGYFLQLKTANEYISTEVNTRNEKPFSQLSKEELADLDRRFVEEIKGYTSYKALKGVIFEDEVGYLSFEGVLHAKEIFDREFPDYEFQTNFLCYTLNELYFWASFVSDDTVVPEEIKPFKLDGENEITFANRYNYYGLFVDGLLAKSHFDFFSFDKYPFMDHWEKCPQFMHICYLDSIAFLRTKKDQFDSAFYTYIGAGQWFGYSPRNMLESEFYLSMHLCALYGIDGFGYFPGFYPVDFVVSEGYRNADNGDAGLIDINGKPTKFYHYLKHANAYFTRIEEDILSAKFLGVKSYGEYYNGFTKEDIKDVKDNEVIYFGELPIFYQMETQSIFILETTNNLAVSEFVKDEKKRFYLVNMSTLYTNDIKIKLPKGNFVVERMDASAQIEEISSLTLEAGEGVYIVEK